MRLLSKSRHWLAPLSAILLSSPAAVMASDNQPTVHNSHKAVTMSAGSEGDIRLRISHKAMSDSPDNLKDALLEVIHNKQTYRTSPVQVDQEGKAHYLVKLGLDEAGTEIQLKPVSATTPLAEFISLMATGVTTLLTLKVADTGYSYLTQADHLPYRSMATDNYAGDIIRNYARQSIMLSTFVGGDAVAGLTASALGAAPPPPLTTGSSSAPSSRTTWKDAIPDITSGLVMGLPSWFLHSNSSGNAWPDNSKLGAFVGMYSASSTTNTLSRALRKLHEAGLHDLTDLDQTRVQRLSQAFTVVESSVVLAALNGLNWAKPGLAGGTSWWGSVLSNSAAITLTYNVRDLTAGLSTDWLGHKAVGELLAAVPMAAFASVMQIWGNHRLGQPLQVGDMSYHSTLAFMSGEAAGASLGFGLQKVINHLYDGDVNAPSTRAARLASAAISVVALKGAARIPQLGVLGNVVSTMGDGVLIANALDAMMVMKEAFIEPWVVTPLLKKTGLAQKETPAIRLNSVAVRRPLFDV
jgi:hypothetical protein